MSIGYVYRNAFTSIRVGNIKRLEIALERIPNILFIPVIGHSVDRVGRCGDGSVVVTFVVITNNYWCVTIY